MIRSLQLENFKAFGERVRIPFAPITLIFGENSSGKSSVLQSLNLLKQTSREPGALLLPRTDRGISDLGSFQDILFDHKLMSQLSIRVESDDASGGIAGALGFIPDVSRGFEVSFERRSIEAEVQLRSIELFLGADELLARFRPFTPNARLSKELISYLPDRRPRFSEWADLTFARCEFITDSHKYWKPFFLDLKERSADVAKNLTQKLENHLAGSSPSFNDQWEKPDRAYRHKIQSAIDFYSSDFDLSQFVSRMCSQQVRSVIGLDGFFPIQTTHLSERLIPEQRASTTPSGLLHFLDIARVASVFGNDLKSTLEMLFPLGSFRRPPERWYISAGTSPGGVGHSGELLPDLLFRNPDLIENANGWLEKLDVGYQLRVQPLGLGVRDLFSVRLVDTRRRKPVEVGLSDVGFGISQILPLIVQSLASDNTIISIEQPEVHIHPRLQADLGGLLAETIKERDNQFLIETHSEHLLLRLQRLVHEKQLSPEDISIIYVSRSPSGAKIQRLNLDEDGDFIDDWPGGFFPERLRELR